MSISPILDAILGLVFIFLVLSLTCTAIQEAISQLFNLRLKVLAGGIRNVLAGAAGGAPEARELTAEFYAHPLLQSLYERCTFGWRAPSYVPARTFAAVVLNIVEERSAKLDGTAPTGENAGAGQTSLRDTIARANLPAGLRRSLETLASDAGHEVAALKTAIERWFDDAMERVSASYKRRIQLVIFVIALVVTVFSNADAIAMARKLSSDASVRDALVAAAEAYATQSRDSVLAAGTANVDSVVARLEAMGLPIGWPAAPDSIRPAGTWSVLSYRARTLDLGRVIGLLLTTFAVSLGAPFWFDILNKVVNIRSAGRAPEERPKPPEALPPAR